MLETMTNYARKIRIDTCQQFEGTSSLEPWFVLDTIITDPGLTILFILLSFSEREREEECVCVCVYVSVYMRIPHIYQIFKSDGETSVL